MDFKEFLDLVQSQAIADRLSPTEASVWEAMCRQYSKTFHTPLHLVLSGEIDPELIAKSYYANQFDDVDVDEKIEQIMDAIYTLEDPNYTSEKEEELKEFISDIEMEEEERVKNNQPLLKHLGEKQRKQKLEAEAKKEATVMPKSGGVNFDYLNKHESEE